MVLSMSRPLRLASDRGFTILEVMVASVIAGVIAVGTMMSFVAAGRIMGVQDNMAVAEAAQFSQQSVEHFRNDIACQAPWFDAATCAYVGPVNVWAADPLPPAPSGGSESILQTVSQRCYRVNPSDCGGGPGSCFAVDVTVCWNSEPTCPC